MTRRGLSLSRVPLKNIRAHPLRSAILMVLTFAQAACALTGLLLVQSVRADLALAEDRLGADVLVYPSAGFLQLDEACVHMLGTPVAYHKKRSTLSRLDSNEDIDRIAYEIYMSDSTGEGEPVWIIGFDPLSDFVVAPWLVKGPDHVVPDGMVAVGVDVPVADSGTTTLFHREWSVDSRLERTGSEFDRAVFVPNNTLKEVISDASAAGVDSYASLVPDRDYSVALVRLKDRDDAESVTNWINLYVRRVDAIHSEESVVGASSSIAKHSGVIGAVAGVTWLVLLGALAVVQSLMMNERRHEVNVWRVVGASYAAVRRVLVQEAFIIHACGALAGVGIAAAVFAFGGSAFVRQELVEPVNLLVMGGIAAAVSLFTGSMSARFSFARKTKVANNSMLLKV